MDAATYLTAEEMTLFKKLPADKRQKWEKNVKAETLKSFETVEELKRRAASDPFKSHPGAKKVFNDAIAALEKSGDPSSISLKAFPEEAIPDFLYGIGASGISAMIMWSLHEPEALGDEAWEDVSALSHARHTILQTNAVFA